MVLSPSSQQAATHNNQIRKEQLSVLQTFGFFSDSHSGTHQLRIINGIPSKSPKAKWGCVGSEPAPASQTQRVTLVMGGRTKGVDSVKANLDIQHDDQHQLGLFGLFHNVERRAGFTSRRVDHEKEEPFRCLLLIRDEGGIQGIPGRELIELVEISESRKVLDASSALPFIHKEEAPLHNSRVGQQP
ncbi:10118_t:CDS:2 [Acaulospora colombiana]|uniref:10118_t:CDS:1 n=1 Tax=Acaulospora colombiana TaxID=27376 RepID=A0ACA9NF80_9GLOM|nr:10118_t:CDS:2 [Acaulospora colombiana]